MTEHTLTKCEAWKTERIALRDAVSENLTLRTVITAMCSSPEAWAAMIPKGREEEKGKVLKNTRPSSQQ